MVVDYVWSVQATPEGIYFQTQQRLFRFRPAAANSDTKISAETWQVKVWQPQTNFGYSFWLDQTLYVQQLGVGLMKMVRDSLVLVPGGQQFANDRMHVMLPFPGKAGNYLLGTFNRGLFLWDGNSFQPFPTDSDDLLRNGPLYAGATLPDSCFAFGSMSTGFFIIDRNGRTKLHLTQASGLTSNTVSYIFVDVQQNIWLAMDAGIAVLEYSSPLSQFGLPSGNGPAAFRRFKGLLYAAANDGVIYLDSTDSQFRYISGISGNAQSFEFCEINNDLFVPVGSGIYRIQDRNAILVMPTRSLTFTPLCLHQSRQDSSIVFCGILNGLARLRYGPKDPDRLRLQDYVAGVREYVRTIIEPEPGIIWLGTLDAGAIRLTYADNKMSNPIIEKFGPEQGLPAGGVSTPREAGRLIFATKQGVYKFDARQKIFSPDSFFADVSLGRNSDESIIVKDEDGNIWANLGRETVVFKRQSTGSYLLQREPLSRFADESTISIYPEKNGVVWFGTMNNVIRLSPYKTSSAPASFSAIIRRVSFANDSIIYHGAATVQSNLTDPARRLIPFRFNALRFDFAAPSYLNPRANEFRTRLEGFDESWSGWSQETRRNYTNLPAGTYRFRVQAKNIYGQVSEDAIYAFTIQTPWYATWWAYLGYVVLAAGFVFGLVRVRTHQLQQRSRALEKIVQDRTAEIKATQEKLVTQSKLAALGALTAGIAHEIKNPLNFVNNFAELSRDLVQELELELTKATPDKAAIIEILHTLQQNAARINEHGKRADSIVRSMLQHSRGKAGERQPTDINAMLEEDINLAYHGMRAQDSSFNIKIETDFDPSISKLDIVPQDISRVFLNIINNGCYAAHRKKLEQDGSFSPTLSVRTRNLKDKAEIRIRDNGNGIPESVREKLFTPFFTTKPAGQGTGLGLSISYDIVVHGHNGQISFQTEAGQFTEFVITIPRQIGK